MRLDKFLSHTGFGSRKEAKKIIKQGAVRINDKAAKSSEEKVNPESDQIWVNDEPVSYQSTIYLMLNKPKGVITATEDLSQRTVLDLLDEKDRILNPFPVGRLDKDTEGLLLITNDGTLAHRLLSPKHHVDKTYIARIEGWVTETDIQAFANGVKLDDGYLTKQARLQIFEAGDFSRISVTITEGKFHQIKRMFQAVGKKVVELKRMAMGPLTLDPSLAPGEYRPLTNEEKESLLKVRK